METNTETAISLIHNNPTLIQALIDRLAVKTKEIRHTTKNLRDVAGVYNDKYTEEVEEGTKKLALLLENGRKLGKTDTEIIENGLKFYPTVRTPILNMLYFLFKEHPDADKIDMLRLTEDIGVDHDQLRERLNKKFGEDKHSESDEHVADRAPEMTEFLYGNLTNETFIKIKKLKALSKDMSNENEASLAYITCMKLCKKHSLEFEKIP